MRFNASQHRVLIKFSCKEEFFPNEKPKRKIKAKAESNCTQDLHLTHANQAQLHIAVMILVTVLSKQDNNKTSGSGIHIDYLLKRDKLKMHSSLDNKKNSIKAIIETNHKKK